MSDLNCQATRVGRTVGCQQLIADQRRRDGHRQQRRLRFREQAFAVGFAPQKDLVGVDAVLARDPRNRSAGLQGFFNDRPLQCQRMVPVGAALSRGNDGLCICVHKSLCGHKFEMPVERLSSFSNIPAERR